MKIFLDLDGTLLDVKYRCYQIYVDSVLSEGFDVLDLSDYWRMKRDKVREDIIVSKTTPPMFVKQYIQERADAIESMYYLMLDVAFDNVLILLDEWRVDNELYLTTLRQNFVNLQKQLHLLELDKYFSSINTLSEPKENFAQRYLGDNLKECIIIGDTEIDIRAGKHLGIRTVGVTSGLRSKKLLEKEHPDIILDNISEFVLDKK